MRRKYQGTTSVVPLSQGIELRATGREQRERAKERASRANQNLNSHDTLAKITRPSLM